MNRGDIRSLVRIWLNERSPGFWLDADLNTLISIANQKVNSLISSLKEDFFTASATFSTVGGQKSYIFPTDLRFLRRIEHTNALDITDVERLDELPFPDSEQHQDWQWVSQSKPKRYRIVGNHFELWPIPDDIYTMRIYYDQLQVALALDPDIPLSPGDFHDMVAVWTVILALPKGSEDSLEYKAIWADRKNDLILTMGQRSASTPVVSGYLE